MLTLPIACAESCRWNSLLTVLSGWLWLVCATGKRSLSTTYWRTSSKLAYSNSCSSTWRRSRSSTHPRRRSRKIGQICSTCTHRIRLQRVQVQFKFVHVQFMLVCDGLWHVWVEDMSQEAAGVHSLLLQYMITVQYVSSGWVQDIYASVISMLVYEGLGLYKTLTRLP